MPLQYDPASGQFYDPAAGPPAATGGWDPTGADPGTIPADCWQKCYAYWSNGQMCPDPCASGLQTPADPWKRLNLGPVNWQHIGLALLLILAVLVTASSFGHGLAERI